MNALLSTLLNRHNRNDVAETLGLYEHELNVSFRAHFVKNGTRIICLTSDGICPCTEIPHNSGTDRIVQSISELLDDVNMYFNTSLTKLKMKREIRGE